MTRTLLTLVGLLLALPLHAQQTCPEGTYNSGTETQGNVTTTICKCLPGRTLVGETCVAPASSSAAATTPPLSEAVALDPRMTFVTDRRVTEYVEGVFNRIVRQSPRPGLAYRVRVCVNCGDPACSVACAQGDGSIYVSSRFMRLLSYEGELAAILAHEVGHVAAGHPGSADDFARATMVAALNGGPIAPIVHRALLMKYSRDNETEADRLAIEMLYRAGIRPTGLTTSLVKLRQEQARRRSSSPGIVDPFAAVYFSTHPSSPERIASIAPLLADPRFNTLTAIDPPDFHTAQSRLPGP